MENGKKELNWFPVEEDSMSTALKAKYRALKKANEAARKAKEDFETSFIEEAKKAERIDTDISLAFGYRFGKLAVAKVDPREVKPSAASKPKFSF
jgi:hypothetical protein